MPTNSRQTADETPIAPRRGHGAPARPSCRRPGPTTGATVALLLAGFLAVPGYAAAAAPSDGHHRSNGTVAAPVVPTATTSPTEARPGNGAVLIKRGSGRGKFTVDNTRGTDDAAVTLSRGGRAVLLIYVRAGSTAVSGRVPDGTFDVFVERGSGWDGSALRFTKSTSTGQFDRQARFSTERIRGGIRYSTITVTLHGVPNGNARVLPVPETAIPG